MFVAPRQIQPAAMGPADVPIGFAPLDQLDLRKIWSVLWRGRTTMLWTTTAALLLAVLIALFAPHRYTAVTQILIDPSDLRAVGHELVTPNQLSDVAVLQVESQVRVLTSDSVLRRVVEAEKLDRDPEFAGPPSLLRRVAILFGMGGGAAAADPTLAALNALKRAVQVKRAERTFVVDVSVISRDADKAARLANAIAKAYLAEQTEVRSNAARQVSQSLSARLKELRERVREAEDRVEAYKARHNIVGASGQLVNEQQLSELNNQLGVARARTAEAKARYEQVQRLQQSKGMVGAFPEAIQSQTITALRSQYAEVIRREAEQVTSLGPRHPAVIEIVAQAERLRRMIAEEVDRVALSARTEYETARSNEEILAASLEALKRTTIATNEALVALRELERDVQASRAVYEAFLVRARETGEQERVDTKNIRVISRADPPLRRSFPPSNLLLAAGALFLGVVAGAGLIILRAPSAEAMPGPGPSGPLAPRGTAPAAKDKDQPVPEVTPGVPILAALPDADVAFGLDAISEPNSPFAKEIRRVQEAVQNNHGKRDHPSVMIVGAGDEDDVATVALSLAAMAATTQCVLLIDADLERRTLAALDADRGKAGLVDIALGGQLLSDVAVRDPQTRISFLPLVSEQSRRDRPIRDEDIRVAFAQTKHFELVVVAAMDCDRDPSGCFFAALVDHIVLVVKEGETAEAAAKRLVASLGLDARKVRGAVVIGAAAA